MAGSAVNLTPMLSQMAQSLSQPAQLSTSQQGLFSALSNSLAPMPQVDPNNPYSLNAAAQEAARRGDQQMARTYAVMAQELETTQYNKRQEQEAMRLRKEKIALQHGANSNLMAEIAGKEKYRAAQAAKFDSTIDAVSRRVGAENTKLLRTLNPKEGMAMLETMLANKDVKPVMTTRIDPETGNELRVAIHPTTMEELRVIGISKEAGKDEGVAAEEAAMREKERRYLLFSTGINTLADDLKKTLTGPLQGLLHIGTATDGQQQVKASKAFMAPILKELFRQKGEGTFTERDQEILLEMIPDEYTDGDTIDSVVERLDRIVKIQLGLESGYWHRGTGKIYSEADIEMTAKNRGMTVEQVKAALKAQDESEG